MPLVDGVVSSANYGAVSGFISDTLAVNWETLHHGHARLALFIGGLFRPLHRFRHNQDGHGLRCFDVEGGGACR